MITWSVVFVVLAIAMPQPDQIAMPQPDQEVSVCPSVLASLTDSGGIPKNAAGFAFGVVAIGFMWWLSGLLSLVYTRWPRFFISLRVLAGSAMGPSARRLGPLVMAGGIGLGLLLQVGCAVTG